MKREEFDELVKTLETKAKANPGGYVRRTIALVFLGYGYLFFVLLFSTAMLVALGAMVIAAPNGLTIKLGIVLGLVFGAIVVSILKGLWVRLPAPPGLEVNEQDAPELFTLLDDISKQLQSQRFHSVILTGEFNAAVVQVPRLGIFGWQKNFLILGLPLMQGLTVEEFKSVMAHEFGHLSANHSRFSGWIYRVRHTWERVIASIAENQGKGSFALTPFLEWYWPKFNATAFVLSRENEYEADACAAEVAGSEASTSALLKVNVQADFLQEKFWPSLYERVNVQPAPPGKPFDESAAALAAPLPEEDAGKWMRASFLIDTNNSDTHPCLRDRLTALNSLPAGVADGVFPAPPEPPERSAATMLLGRSLERLTSELNREWSAGMTPVWQQRHHEARQIQQKLAEIPEGDEDELTEEQLWEKATLLLDLKGDEGVVPVLDQLLARKPDHAPACFVRGRYLLGAENSEGLDWIERSMKMDESLVADGLNLLYGYYARHGMRDELKTLEQRFDEHQEFMNRAQVERNNVTANDEFTPHELSADESRQLCELFQQYRDIGKVFIARKKLTLMPESPLFLVCLEVNVPFWKPRSSAANEKIVNGLAEQIRLEGQFLVFVRENDLKSLGKAIKTAPGSLVYERTK